MKKIYTWLVWRAMRIKEFDSAALKHSQQTTKSFVQRYSAPFCIVTGLALFLSGIDLPGNEAITGETNDRYLLYAVSVSLITIGFIKSSLFVKRKRKEPDHQDRGNN